MGGFYFFLKSLGPMWEAHNLTAVGLGAWFKCNHNPIPFAAGSLNPNNEMVHGLCLQGHRQKDGLIGRLTHINDNLLNLVIFGLQCIVKYFQSPC